MISIIVDSEGTRRALTSLAGRVKDRTVPNRQLSAQLTGWVFKDFDAWGKEQTPPWAPLKSSTIKAKAKAGYSAQPLVRSGNLRSSFLGFYDNDSAGVGAQASFGVDYAEFHENGVASRNLPARKMLPPEKVAANYAIRIYDLYISTSISNEGLS